MCQAPVTPRPYPEIVGIFRDLCTIVWDIVHDPEGPADEDGDLLDWVAGAGEGEGDGADLDDYDPATDGWWTCRICGFDANDHDTCMGCGHPLTPETFSLG